MELPGFSPFVLITKGRARTSSQRRVKIMAVMIKEPEISERFDLDDIRKIREYNAARYEGMTPAEIVADTKAGAAEFLEKIKKWKFMKE